MVKQKKPGNQSEYLPLKLRFAASPFAAEGPGKAPPNSAYLSCKPLEKAHATNRSLLRRFDLMIGQHALGVHDTVQRKVPR